MSAIYATLTQIKIAFSTNFINHEPLSYAIENGAFLYEHFGANYILVESVLTNTRVYIFSVMNGKGICIIIA